MMVMMVIKLNAIHNNFSIWAFEKIKIAVTCHNFCQST
ncbi:hypothetical protein yberc0001_17530 [Yersinia bercovieri ATCC 43970]|uniref:Uncharacterized protein n=1 Tax=Yersinia bercovieri ATCC 43970 TaxID=349968 RepID=A0ABM9XZB8_YERBE|nr:hypothetical protein yberc0001_17530 [Yersinia bercovieri ATCC 43970]